MKIKIGFLDSGIGGLTYLHGITKNITENQSKYNEVSFDIFYLADHAGFPYGEKKEDFLSTYLLTLIPEYVKFCQLDMIIIACNTASVLILNSLRSVLRLPIIGVVPAIKPAVESNSSRIYVMNTNTATETTYIKDMIENPLGKYGYDAKIFLRGCQELVDAIEDMIFQDDEAFRAHTSVILSRIVEEIKELDCKTVVLGCTHFLHISNILRKLLNDEVNVIDSLDGVINRTIVLLDQLITHSAIVATSNNRVDMEVYFMYTSNNKDKDNLKYQRLCAKYNMTLKGKFTY